MSPRLLLMLAIQRARAAGFGQFAAALEQMLRQELAVEQQPLMFPTRRNPGGVFVRGRAEPAHLTRRRHAWHSTRRSMDSRSPFGVPAQISVSSIRGSGCTPVSPASSLQPPASA